MFDAYEVLGIERRLTLSDEYLRERYQELSKTRHPDAQGSEALFRELAEAYEVLRSPGRRLRHWLEVGGVEGDPRGTIDAPLVSIFGEVAAALNHADGFIRRREAASTALSRALLEREAGVRRAELEGAMARVEAEIAGQLGCFVRLEEDGQQMAAEEGWTVTRNLGFLEKWRSQLRERFGRLF